MPNLAFKALCKVSDDVLSRNRKINNGRGLPEVGDLPVVPKLAVVGGGHSIADHVQDLRDFDGEVWAINGTFKWCQDNGIEATFYAIDPLPEVAFLCEGATDAVLANTCDPSTFDVLHDANVEIAKIGIDDILHDTTAASTAPMIASRRGHSNITFFGCESSFPEGQTHKYKNDEGQRIWLKCGGKEFLTNPFLLMQATFLAEVARALPDFITLTGGGLLTALRDNGSEYTVTHTTRDLADRIKTEANYEENFQTP